MERMASYASYRVGNVKARQTGAAIERIFSNTRHGAGNVDACQAGAAFERTIKDACDGVGFAIIGDSGGNGDVASIGCT